tara:strand:- start:19 stop:519 length:501 start_codon:yes stop_codon:yes gene_type:complete
MVPLIANELRNMGENYSFILTLPEESSLWHDIKISSKKLGVEKFINNVGVLKINECLDWYRNSFLVFMPTLLEVFSATYLEAMAMRKTILTSDMDFSREICGDAAYYFNPESAEDAATAVNTIYQDGELRKQLVSKGIERLRLFPSSKEKNEELLNWFKKIINEKQ